MVSRTLLVMSAAAVLLCAMPPAPAQVFPDRPVIVSGRATVIDGETLDIRGQRIRLAGIEQPADDHVCERTDTERWRCGPRAVNALDELLEEAIVSCVVREQETPRVGACSVGPVDLSLWLLRNGLARAASAPAGKYAKAQAEAMLARRGIWAERANSD
jgi:endonuclease YncB( thermonuclease family)